MAVNLEEKRVFFFNYMKMFKLLDSLKIIFDESNVFKHFFFPFFYLSSKTIMSANFRLKIKMHKVYKSMALHFLIFI